ncbi:2-iminoacetate synthase ThiH [Agaribacterium sp. ZY112]|uniref:2-iminoacetate synthase ThiH n=1 Tax=Agaribacterium sp. ZY112 TaxID=3233574 RepID=UPI00352526F7
MSFVNEFEKHSWSELKTRIYSSSTAQVEHALYKKGRRNWQDFLALISPAAVDYLEPMAQLSQQQTRKCFGKTIQLYVPMYLSNKCANHCIYCGFSIKNRFKRRSLKDGQILMEAEALKNQGHQQLLLVTGETIKIGVDYVANALDLLSPLFSSVSIETQPFEQDEYEYLRAKGLHGVTLYQETYNKERYGAYHLSGNKANFNYRLASHDRVGAARVHKIGLGVLLGLEDWRVDSAFAALHLTYLERQYWQSRFSVSFPRLRNAEGFKPENEISDKELLQLICAYRLFNPFVDLSLSTRESQHYRDHVFKLGISSMSAGARTSPGAYSLENEELEQFEICDERSASDVATMLKQSGYDVVWKDWSEAFIGLDNESATGV